MKEQLSPNPSDISGLFVPTQSTDPTVGFATVIDPSDVRNGLYRVSFKGPKGRFVINRQVVSVSLQVGPSTSVVDDPVLAPSGATVVYGPSNIDGVQVIKEVQSFNLTPSADDMTGQPCYTWSLNSIQNVTLPSSIYGRDRWVVEIALSGYSEAIGIDALTTSVIVAIQVN